MKTYTVGDKIIAKINRRSSSQISTRYEVGEEIEIKDRVTQKLLGEFRIDEVTSSTVIGRVIRIYGSRKNVAEVGLLPR